MLRSWSSGQQQRRKRRNRKVSDDQKSRGTSGGTKNICGCGHTARRVNLDITQYNNIIYLRRVTVYLMLKTGVKTPQTMILFLNKVILLLSTLSANGLDCFWDHG